MNDDFLKRVHGINTETEGKTKWYQTDRYDLGFHDAMAKNREMLTQKIEP